METAIKKPHKKVQAEFYFVNKQSEGETMTDKIKTVMF